MDERHLGGYLPLLAGLASACLVITSILPGLSGIHEAHAGTQAPTWVDAVQQTKETGITSLLVVTSTNVAPSRELYRSLAASLALPRLQDQVVVAELSADAEASQVERLRVGCSSVIAFRRGPSGALERAATYQGPPSAENVLAWLIERKLLTSNPIGSAPLPDSSVVQAGWGHNTIQPSPQGPYLSAPAPVREVVEERPVERRVVRRVVERQPREVLVREVAPREVLVREEPAPRRIVREIREFEEPAPRNVLSRPRDIPPPRDVPPTREVLVREVPAPREVVVREVSAPRDVEEVEELEEVTPRSVAPREVVRRVPRQVVVRDVEPTEPSQLDLIQVGPIDRMIGALGNRLRRRGLPRVNVEVETQRTVHLVPAPTNRVVMAPQQVAPREATYCPPAQPQPTYGPSLQSAPPPPAPIPSPQLPR